jgi:hypothetical protein
VRGFQWLASEPACGNRSIGFRYILHCSIQYDTVRTEYVQKMWKIYKCKQIINIHILDRWPDAINLR